ncbi:MAG: outer membrane beta-barrel protein [Bacteroidales bacterium]|nr:outer membrane beta-barrel protein [Bacteroidales bacterium]
MKKIFILAAIAMMAFSASASAKGFGITGGMNFNSAKIKDVKMDAQAGWNAGITYAFNLPLGFSIQPALVYSQTGALVEKLTETTQTVGSINLPVSLQWGPDLLVARPFVDFTPYVGYSLFNKVEGDLLKDIKGGNGFEYGLGVGAGLNIWKFQAIVRYNWNFGVLGSLKDFTEIDLGSLNPENQTYGGISFHLAFFF